MTNSESFQRKNVSLSVFFPCYNEEGNVADTVGKAVKVLEKMGADYEIIIVNDGSSDRTGEIADKLAAFKPLKGVYGNIDGYDIRSVYPEKLRWTCEEVKVLMIHIGGYPGKYSPAAKAALLEEPAQLFISGHSHILKIQYDPTMGCLHINPGAAGRQGWHKVSTLVRFVIDGKDIRDAEVIELARK